MDAHGDYPPVTPRLPIESWPQISHLPTVLYHHRDQLFKEDLKLVNAVVEVFDG
jgi:hypothetical protein